MPITIGTNIASLGAQRRLSDQSQKIGSVFERLSTRQRINRASDDAAGLAIADSLRADTRVYTRGIANLNDGLSYLNVYEGGLQSLTDILIRQKELAEQAANGSYSNKQRGALQEEVETCEE